jgi:formylmethanofuran dehydrogenase subunit A
VNEGRILRPEDHAKDVEFRTPLTRSGVGHSIPSTWTTGYRYARMGYTSVIEPATAPLKARHTHEELNDIPIVDKACFPLLGNNWLVMEYVSKGRIDECSAYVAWVLWATKGYAIKIVNPGGIEAWAWGKNVSSLDDEVPHFNITPREIVRGLCRVSKSLNLPHPIHVHPNNLGKPGNFQTTIETMDCVRDIGCGEPVLHVTHVQFEAYGGSDWASMSSKAPEIARYVNAHDHLTIDMGQIVFTDTTTMTADGPFQYQLHLLSGNKWMNCDVEIESGAGIVPLTYKRSNPVNAVQWAIGLELALLIDDPWKVYLTTDHPNGGPFNEYPQIISWLMSKRARMRTISKIPSSARRRIHLESTDRELTFSEIVVMTRAGPARALGLENKGHLAPGADADVAVYSIDPKSVDPSADYGKLLKSFSSASYVVKEGEIVVNNGRIARPTQGRTFWVDAGISDDHASSMVAELESKFADYYTMKIGNYVVQESYLQRPFSIRTSAQGRKRTERVKQRTPLRQD